MTESPIRMSIVAGTLHGCDAELMDDIPRLRAIVLDAVRAAGLTEIHTHFHAFSPQGVTGAVILAESHITLHTWPEYGCLFLDVATCSGEATTRVAFEALSGAISHTRWEPGPWLTPET